MRALLTLAALVALAAAAPAAAQISNPPGVTQGQLDAVAATIPLPASSVPPAETVAGAAGSQAAYRRGDAVQPRITRAANCTLDATGACSVTWSTALTAAPTIVTTPVNPSAVQAIMCNTTATPTTTGASIKCWITQTTALSLAIVTAGLSLSPAATAPAGTVVQIIALPPTQ